MLHNGLLLPKHVLWDLENRGMRFKEGEVQTGFFTGDLGGTLGRNSMLMVLIVLLIRERKQEQKSVPCVRCVTKEALERIPRCSGNNPCFLNPLAVLYCSFQPCHAPIHTSKFSMFRISL